MMMPKYGNMLHLIRHRPSISIQFVRGSKFQFPWYKNSLYIQKKNMWKVL